MRSYRLIPGWKGLVIFLSVIGPGIITASIDNDAPGITTYSVAGARFGYMLLWTLIPTTVLLIIVQEMVARMGVVTGKGLSDLIRENYGVRITFFMMVVLLIANLGTTTAEFAGWAASMELFGLNKYLMVPAGAFIIWLLVTRGSYRVVERVLLIACLIYFGYVISAFMAAPEWGEVVKATFLPRVKLEPDFIMLSIAIVGTTVTPWMQFYLQSSIAEKGVKQEEYRFSKIDVIVGCLITDIVAFFIIVTCAATLFANNISINEAREAALALKPFAGRYATALFAVSLANASILGAIVVPLATAYYICEAMGWEAGINKTFKEAPQFMWIYTALIVASACFVLIPKAPLIFLMVISSFLNGILLPFVLVFALSLVNNHRIMGKYTNPKAYNYISWGAVVVLTVLTAVLFFMSIRRF
jgi:NRAMP (natural resistance-associated macrophage protein)-like metal ion transporter